MAEVYAPRKELDLEGFKQLEKKLTSGVPGVHFPQHVDYINGQAVGYRYENCYQPDVVIFYDFGLAVINRTIPDKDSKVEALEKIGYIVSKAQMAIRMGGTPEAIHKASTILWEEMRKGFAQERIRENLERLLTPIMTSYREINQFEFAVYNPCVVTSTDDVIPPYIEYEEVFSVQANERGTVDFGLLVKRISQLENGRALALSSRVLTSEGRRHIPMIDFKSEEVYYDQVLRMMQRLNIPFKFLVVSSIINGNAHYHHYYTNKLMNDREFNKYLSLLQKQPEVGEAWTLCQTEQEFALLRVTPSASKLWFPEIIEVTAEDFRNSRLA